MALTLRLLGGLTTPEIARAFLVTESTVAQRLVRAKRTLRDAKVPFEVPAAPSCGARLPSVLEVIYLVFNEGYAASAGEDWIRPALCEEALRLGRILAELAPAEPEAHGLIALLEIQASRSAARLGPRRRAGPAARPGPLALGPAADRPRPGGAGAGRKRCAARSAPTGCRPRSPPATPAGAGAEETDWVRIAALYDALSQLTPSPIVELNRAVALTMAFGPEAGLELLDRIAAEPALAGYHLLPSVRGDLLAKLGRGEEAAAEFRRAAELTGNERERELLLRRAAEQAAG